MKQFFYICAFSFSLFILHFFISSVSAQPAIDFPNYDVEITINEDSSMIVRETITNRFNGISNGLRRDVTVENPNLSSFCETNPDSTCGGFNELFIIGAYDEDGNQLTAADGFRTYEIETESGQRFVRFEWQIWNDEFQEDTEVTWTVEYELWGAIQWRNPGGISTNTSGEDVAYLYWNALPESRTGNVEESSVSVVFPDTVQFNANNLVAYTLYESDFRFDQRTNMVLLNLENNLGTFGDYTVGYEFLQGELTEPGSIDYSLGSALILGELYIDDVRIREIPSGLIEGVPAGQYEVRGEALGFESKAEAVVVESGQTTEIDLELSRTPFFQVLFYLGLCIMLIGCFIIPLGPLWVWRQYRKKGRDKDMPKTIVPEFEPPEGVRPYLLGSIKDEKVDKEDIVGTIIDLAYRGFISIKEIKKGKNYEMIRKKDIDESILSSVEKGILDAIFNGQDTMQTKEMRNHFPQKYTAIVSDIYSQMVTDGYFASSPRAVRSSYAGVGVSLLIVGILIVGCASIALTVLINFPILFTPGFAIALAGFIMLFVATHMPAKTTKGSKTFADILGFKMYIHTAERFRLQELGPEEFERFLSYAIVFKIEKEWAKKFEGIYEGSPDWYSGSDAALDAILISSFARSFSDAATVATTPISNSSTSGGGWSGGGSFGGFSGGGGGGGSVGGW